MDQTVETITTKHAADDPTHWRRFISQLPTGTRKALSVDWSGAAGARAGVEIAFVDAAGRSWIRDWKGQLKEVVERDHLKQLGLQEPLEWDFEGPAGDFF